MNESRPEGQLSAEELAGRLGEVLSDEEMDAVAGGSNKEFSFASSEAGFAV